MPGLLEVVIDHADQNSLIRIGGIYEDDGDGVFVYRGTRPEGHWHGRPRARRPCRPGRVVEMLQTWEKVAGAGRRVANRDAGEQLGTLVGPATETLFLHSGAGTPLLYETHAGEHDAPVAAAAGPVASVRRTSTCPITRRCLDAPLASTCGFSGIPTRDGCIWWSTRPAWGCSARGSGPRRSGAAAANEAGGSSMSPSTRTASSSPPSSPPAGARPFVHHRRAACGVLRSTRLDLRDPRWVRLSSEQG